MNSVDVEALSLQLAAFFAFVALVLGTAALMRRLGRFLQVLVPRLENQLAERIHHLDGLVPGIARPLRIALLQFAPRDPLLSAGLLRVLRALPAIVVQARQRGRLVLVIFQRQLMRRSTFDPRFAEPLAREISALAMRSVYAVIGRALVDASRPWHRLCALTMLGAGVCVQLGVALFYGLV